MKEKVYNFTLRLDWKLLKTISQIDTTPDTYTETLVGSFAK